MKNALESVVAIAALTLMSTASWAADTVDDATMTAAVKAALVKDPVAKAYQIDVESEDGVVQLNGFVDSKAGRDAAEKDALTVDGVTRVDNNLEVRTASREAGTVVDDATITAKVKGALLADDATEAMKVNVETNNGTVQLSGFVPNDEMRDRAANAARSVEGVMMVQNNITVGH